MEDPRGLMGSLFVQLGGDFLSIFDFRQTMMERWRERERNRERETERDRERF